MTMIVMKCPVPNCHNNPEKWHYSVHLAGFIKHRDDRSEQNTALNIIFGHDIIKELVYKPHTFMEQFIQYTFMKN